MVELQNIIIGGLIMEKNNKLALIVSYYLSKFNKTAYKNLGFSSFKETYEEVGRRLQVNKNSIKNMRDEFDPLHDNNRVGWYQRELRPSREKVVEKFQELDEEDLREIVLEIIFNKKFSDTENCKEILETISDNDKTKNDNYKSRGVTGKKAEEIFLKYYENNKKPINGELVDTRYEGCGYDFKIKNNKDEFYVEVKGISDEIGGILFTSKEWKIARREKNKYFLVIISNLSNDYKITTIQNPVKKIEPEKNIYTSVQINWNVPANELTSYINNSN